MSRAVLLLLTLTTWPSVTSAGTNAAGLKFLEENKGREGVVTLKSGLQYKVLKKGTGKYRPKKATSCECHYAGTTPALTPDAINKDESKWNEFDSSYKRGTPTSFAPNQVIKGWTQAMQLMVEGDKWEMYIPSEMGYGDTGSGDKIKGGDVLIFRMEMLKINGPKNRAFQCDLKTKENCEPEEVKVLNTWEKKTLRQVEAQMEVVKKKLDGTFKEGQREKVETTYKMLRRLQKEKKMDAKKKSEL